MWHRVRRSCLGAVGVTVLVACSGGDGVRSVGTLPTAPSTTTTAPEPGTTTTVAAAGTTSTARAVSTTTTAPRPVVVDGIPQVTATPARGPVGTRVRIEGTGFTDAMWRVPGASLWLVAPTGCGAYAEAQHTVTVSANGRLTGELTVPAVGGCRQGDGEPVALRAGTHRIVFSCTPCHIGQFEVTGTAAECENVGFTPNSDDVASSILAFNLPCADATALVRKVGPQVGAVGGPARVEADGFTCVRTAQDDGAVGLASSTFDCTSGIKKVLFVRT